RSRRGKSRARDEWCPRTGDSDAGGAGADGDHRRSRPRSRCDRRGAPHRLPRREGHDGLRLRGTRGAAMSEDRETVEPLLEPAEGTRPEQDGEYKRAESELARESLEEPAEGARED